MIIRSQDKKTITRFENVSVKPIEEHVYAHEWKVIGYRVVSFNRENCLVIGEYSTEEKAIKVLDMICDRAEGIFFEKIDYAKCEHIYSNIFQMPQDSEV